MSHPPAPERKLVYFLSDLHLGAAYLKDKRASEMRAVRFLESIRYTAAEVYLLGDVLDYWYEYRTVVPRGYVRFFGALASLADAGIKIHWFIGNHDIWLFDYLRDELGIEVIDGVQIKEILGKKFFLNHGDGVGWIKPGFRFIRSIFRNKLLQKLYSGIHPRWTIPLAHLWSAHNRHFMDYVPRFKGMDGEPLAIFAKEYYQDVDPTINYFVFGHVHVSVNEAISPSCRLVILGDWIRLFTYAVFDGNNLEMRKFEE